RASAVHEDLTTVVLRGGSVEGVAETLGKALQRPVVIFDRDLAPVAHEPAEASGCHSAADDGLDPAVREAINASRRSGRCVFVGDGPPRPEVSVAVVAGETFLGAV